MSLLTYNDFRNGMVSEYLRRRPDIEAYQSSARLLENVVPLRTGGVKLRPGTSLAFTPHTATCRLIPVTFSVREQYIFTLRPSYLTIWSLNTENKWTEFGTFSSPLATEDEILEAQSAQDYEKVIIVQRNHPPFVVRRDSATGGWTAGDIVLDASTDAYEYSYDEEGNETKVAFNYDYEGLFTTNENTFPSVVAFCASRLWLGGSRGYPYRFYVSRPFDHFNFQIRDYYNEADEGVTVQQYLDAIGGGGNQTLLIVHGYNKKVEYYKYDSDGALYDGYPMTTEDTNYEGNTTYSKQEIIDTNRQGPYTEGDATYYERTVTTYTPLCYYWICTKTVDYSSGTVVATNAYYDYDYDNATPGTVILGHAEYNSETGSYNTNYLALIADGQQYTNSYKYTSTVYKLENVVSEDSAIILDMASDRDETISWIAAFGDYLYVGTASSEHVIPAGITATDFSVTKIGSQGSADFLQPAYGQNSVMYVQSGREQIRSIYMSSDGIGYGDLTYQCKDILTGKVKSLIWQRVQEPRLYCLLKDGSLSVNCYDTDYGVNAWCHWTIENTSVLSLGVIDNEDGQEVFLLAKKEDGTVGVLLLEEGIFTDWSSEEATFKGIIETNYMQSLNTMRYNVKTYSVAADSMNTRFKAGVTGKPLASSFDYSKRLIVLHPWSAPTIEGLSLTIESIPGENFILLALLVEAEVSE